LGRPNVFLLEVFMPRRSPGEIRTQLPRRRTHHRRAPVICGLSASANRQIAVFERSHGLLAGEVAHAFRRWNTDFRRSRGDLDRFYVRDDTDLRNGDYHVRNLLEITLHALRSQARRELSAVIELADERVLNRTFNNPFAHPDHLWWMRRIDLLSAAAAVDPQRVRRHRRPGGQGSDDLSRFSRRAVDGGV